MHARSQNDARCGIICLAAIKVRILPAWHIEQPGRHAHPHQDSLQRLEQKREHMGKRKHAVSAAATLLRRPTFGGARPAALSIAMISSTHSMPKAVKAGTPSSATP
jgi:hypothetical protein